ncbi:MAG: flagellin N-terminal helical domain-containing protein [Alphaproteobacteria bacterium]
MLSKSARSTLLSMANNASQIKQTQFRMSSGRKFNSILDGGSDYQKARGYQKSADELQGYKQNMDDGLNVIKSTISGVKSSKSMLQQLRSVAEDAQDGSLTEALASSRAGNIVSQYDNLVGDTGLQGVNLVNGSLGGDEAGGGAVNPYDPALWDDISADVGYSNLSAYNYQFVEYDGKLFMGARNGDTSKQILLTYDGTTWTDITADLGSSNFGNGFFQEYNGKLLMSGRDGDTSTNKVLSYDGTTWTDMTADFGTTSFDTYQAVEYDGKLYIPGYDRDTSINKLFTYDGTTTTEITADTGFSEIYTDYIHATEDGLLLQIEDAGGDWSYKAIKYDGTTWTDITAGFMADTGMPDAYFMDVYDYNGDFFVGTYDNDTGDRRAIFQYDGTTWTDIGQTLLGYPAEDVTLGAFYTDESGVAFVTLYDQDMSEGKIFQYDGTTWTDMTPDLLADTGLASDAPFYDIEGSGGKLFMSVGNWRDDLYRVLMYDGESWTDVTTDVSGGMTEFDVTNAGIHEYNGEVLFLGKNDVTSSKEFFTYSGDVGLDDSANTEEASGYNINFSTNAGYGINTQDLRSTSVDLDIATLDFTAAGAVDTIAKIDAAIDQMEVYERQLSTSSILIQTRVDFTETMVSSYTEMYDNLTLSDINEEAANLMALQTQQQLMMNALSFGMDSQASLLSLFR